MLLNRKVYQKEKEETRGEKGGGFEEGVKWLGYSFYVLCFMLYGCEGRSVKDEVQKCKRCL